MLEIKSWKNKSYCLLFWILEGSALQSFSLSLLKMSLFTYFLTFNFTSMKKRSLHFSQSFGSPRRGNWLYFKSSYTGITKQRWSRKVQCMYAGSLLSSLRVVSLCIIEACWKSSSALESTLSAWDFIWNWNTANFKQIIGTLCAM